MSATYSRIVLAVAIAGVLFLLAKIDPQLGDKKEATRISIVPTVAGAKPTAIPPRERIDVTARDAEGRTLLWRATQKRDHEEVQKLLDLRANVDDADAQGMTPLMIAASAGDADLIRTLLKHKAKRDAVDSIGETAIHHAVSARQPEAVEILLESVSQLEPSSPDKPDLVGMACETDDRQIISAVFNRAPANLEWTANTRRVLKEALAAGELDLTRLVLAKHPSPPTLEERNVPLLAQAIVDEDLNTFRALLAAGADPNTVLPLPVDKGFLQQLPQNLRDYTKADEGITPLMIAAGTGKPQLVRALLDAGADKNRMTRRFKMLALYFAVRTEKYKAVQMLLGSGPTPEDLRIEISLATQRASVIKSGSQIFQTVCSTGREGFATRRGSYVITDKSRSHRSSIYKVEMPYFMRLNCLDFGMHEGVVPNHPASHGCIRLPSAAARKLFSEIPVGTVVKIN